MSRVRKPATKAVPAVHYPTSDGKPLGETGFHVDALFDLFQRLGEHFLQQQIYVAASMFLYYKEGDPASVTTPDVMVIKGVDKHMRHTFQTWVENACPCAIFELTSQQTFVEDVGQKRELYAELGVRDYFVYDPEAECLAQVRGFRLRRGQYVPIEPNADGSLTSRELGLRIARKRHILRLRDTRTGALVLTPHERWLLASRRRKQAEQRTRELREYTDALAAETQALAAETQALAAEADARAAHADALAAELEQLRGERNARKRNLG